MANYRNGTTYLGVTGDLRRRAYEHRHGLIDGHSRKHGCKRIVWYMVFDDIQEARRKELQMKKWHRRWKLRVIEEMNPNWDDLFETL